MVTKGTWSIRAKTNGDGMTTMEWQRVKTEEAKEKVAIFLCLTKMTYLHFGC